MKESLPGIPFERRSSEFTAQVHIRQYSTEEECRKLLRFLAFKSSENLNGIQWNGIDNAMISQELIMSLSNINEPTIEDVQTILQKWQEKLSRDCANFSFTEIRFAQTLPGDATEIWHRDAGFTDNDRRVLVFGNNVGPGIEFASGFCDYADQTGKERRNLSQPGFGEPSGKIRTVDPVPGRAVIFYPNMCHRRQQKGDGSSRWNFLLLASNQDERASRSITRASRSITRASHTLS
jgi:hypothetical protein